MSKGSNDAGDGTDGQVSPVTDAASPTEDGGGNSSDDTGPGSDDAAVPIEGDAAPRNSTCTPLSEQTGTIVNTDHGRLDGTLVYVLPVDGANACNGDDSHVHLQVEVTGLVYDIAVDIGSTGDDVGMYQDTLAVPGGAWAEGWHGTDTLTYTSLGLSSTTFPITTPTTIANQVETLLENTSKISIFCTGYAQGDGCHDVHYENGGGKDGAIILDPTSATSSILFFRFQSETF